jgi:hypothetical protein
VTLLRILAALFACLAYAVAASVRADPPSTTANSSAATPPAASASTPAHSNEGSKPTVVVTAPEDILEKHFLAEGYKEEMHNGEKVLCRREESTGSRLGAKRVCSTAQQLQVTEEEAKAAYQRGTTQQTNPKGN